VKNSYDEQRNCTKHVEFYSKNKFQKLVHLVGFIIRTYHDAQSPECQRPAICVDYLWHQFVDTNDHRDPVMLHVEQKCGV
jgi:hypothetical protein